MIDKNSLDTAIGNLANLHLSAINEYSIDTFRILIDNLVEDTYHEFVLEQYSDSPDYETMMNNWLYENRFSYQVPHLNSTSGDGPSYLLATVAIVGSIVTAGLIFTSHIKSAILAGIITAGSTCYLKNHKSPKNHQFTIDWIVNDCKSQVHSWIDSLEMVSSNIISEINKR